MKKRYRHSRLILFIFTFLLISFTLTGCKPGYLDGLEGKKLGVYLTTEKGNREQLISMLADYIRNRTELEVLGLQKSGMNMERPELKRNRQENKLDYLLLVTLTDVSPVRRGNDVNLSPKNLHVRVDYQCDLTMTYQLYDLETENLVLNGETRGKARESNSVNIGSGGINFHLDDVSETRMIEKAMYNAIRKTDLL